MPVWEVPYYRVRAYVESRRRARESAGRRQRPVLSLNRVPAEVMVTDGLATPRASIQARVVLNDFTPKHLRIFSAEPLREGQSVALYLQSPTAFYVRGFVRSSARVALSPRVFQAQPYPYRVDIEFTFRNAKEEAVVRAYCHEVVSTYVATRPSERALSPQ